MLAARLGSDGHSSLINGTVRSTGLSDAPVNPLIGLSCVLVAVTRGVGPGIATLVHPVVVGLSVQSVLPLHLTTNIAWDGPACSLSVSRC